MNIMIVDDSKVMRVMIKRALATAGIECETVEAGDGVEALTMVTNSLDLILVDWNMPNMNGVEFVRQLRTSNDTPVIMVTTETHVAKKQEATNAGANGFLAKPFTPEQLSEHIHEVAGSAQ